MLYSLHREQHGAVSVISRYSNGVDTMKRQARKAYTMASKLTGYAWDNQLRDVVAKPIKIMTEHGDAPDSFVISAEVEQNMTHLNYYGNVDISQALRDIEDATGGYFEWINPGAVAFVV